MPELNLTEGLKKCVRCGQCRFVCPIFEQEKDEASSPRGRIALVKAMQEGKYQPSQDMLQKMYNCLLCKTCVSECPSGVLTDELILKSRAYLDQVMGTPWWKKTVFQGFLTRPALLHCCFGLMRLYQKTGLQSLLTKTRMIELLPGDLPQAEKIMPVVSGIPARKMLPDRVPAKGLKKIKVAYFLGCASNLIYPEIPLAAVEVLSKLGFEVIISQELKCCGMPALAYGQERVTRDLALANISILLEEGVEAVVSDCATCSSTLIAEYPRLFPEDSLEYTKAQALSHKAMDLTKFIVEKAGVPANLKEVNRTVTYHDPCHLIHCQKVSRQPRELLRAIPGVSLKEAGNAAQCCGSAGSFSLAHYDLSMKILNKKISGLAATGADTVATCCPTCMMQLNFGLKKNGVAGQTLHPVQILAEAME
ncbi:MAG: (Fe-S)-binding protein [Bacillota bacterium]